MAYNDDIIKTLREGFEIDKYNQFTNCALIFAYNGTGKTRLSYDFAHFGREEDSAKHTLYYNAYTEDLFTWKNDHVNNTDHYLRINQESQMIQGLAGYTLDESLHKYLRIFSDIDFEFLYEDKENHDLPYGVSFSKHKFSEDGEETVFKNIKISRGEERLFVWCFFRCIMEHVLSEDPAYKDIEYIYIDDPMSSLDDNNVVAFAAQLYNVVRQQKKKELDILRAGKELSRRFKFIFSSHHALFFHVMAHGLKGDGNLRCYYLSRNKTDDIPVLKRMDENTAPFYYNVAMMAELQKAIDNEQLYTYHFNVLRSIMEKIKEFFGHWDFRFILDGITYNNYKLEEGGDLTRDELNDLYSRIVNVFSHQYSVFAPTEMNEDDKRLAKNVFYHIKKKYKFQLPDLDDERSQREIREGNRNNRA